MILYKSNFDENRRIYFLIKEENVFDSFKKVYENLRKYFAISSKTNLIVNLNKVKNI